MPPDTRHSPFIGVTLHGLGLAEPETAESVTEGFLRLRDETPLNSVEIWMAPEHKVRPAVYWPEDYTAERQRAMRTFLDQFDYCGVHLPFLFNNYIAPNPAVAGPAREQMRLGIKVAGQIGCKYAVAHAEWDNRGFLSEDDTFNRYRDAFGDFASLAERNGMLFCVETCFFIGHRARAVRMVQEVGHPNFRITLDAGKAMLNNDGSNENVHRLIDEIGEHIGSTHLYDYPNQTDYSRVLPGCGRVDVRGFVAHLWEKGYRGVFNLETSAAYEQQKQAILALARYADEASR